MDNVYARLEAEYCPPLDPALLSAILSDFNLSSEPDVQQAKSTLDPLKESALLEEQFGFDASGTGARDDGLLDEARTESCPGTSVSQSRETDFTSISNELSSLDLELAAEEANIAPGAAEDLEALDEDTKIRFLLEVFEGRINSYNARYTLRKCSGNWHKAMEELLNHVYFEEAGSSVDGTKISAKGIDGFSEDNVIRRGRKGKGKSKALRTLQDRRSSSLPVSPVDAELPRTNKWQAASEDVEFITSKTSLSTKSVTSIYYSTGASLPRTIAAILDSSIEKNSPTDDPILAVNAHDLGQEFSSISYDYAAAIVRLTHPSTANAHEIAKALTAVHIPSSGGLQVIANYRRPGAADLDPSVQGPLRKLPTSQTSTEHSPIRAFGAGENASAYAARRSAALSQAYAAHRKAKSDRLMGGVAAYYGQLGREYGVMSIKATADAADELAASQSTLTQLDLHGIDVLNAVRIAQDKVEQWWNGLGENRVNGRIGIGERQSGYRIVVGLGRHSEGGKSKLGPAVTKMLKSGGWRYEPDGAVILVKGRARA